MPTKPSAIVVRASDLNYTTGPALLNGTVTKITTVDALTREGYRVDSPLGTFPVPAQAINFFNNQTDVWIDAWVFLGTSANDQDAHIIETDSTGNVGIASVVAGGTTSNADALTVNPNTGTSATGLLVTGVVNKPSATFETAEASEAAALFTAPGISSGANVGIARVEVEAGGPTGLFVTAATSGGSPTFASAVIVEQIGSVGVCVEARAGPGSTVEASGGGAAFWGIQGAPDGGEVGGLAALLEGDQTTGDVVHIDQTNAGANGDCLVVTGTNRALCLKATQLTGKRPALRLETLSPGGDASAPLLLVPQNFSLAGEGAIDGSIWIQSDTLGPGDDQFHPRYRADQSRWLSWTVGPTCAIDGFIIGTEEGPTTDSFFTVISGIFPERMIPIETGTVIITFKCRVRRTSVTHTIPARDGALFRVRDLTAGGTPTIYSDTFDLPPITADEDNRIYKQVIIEFEYALPTSGIRTFTLESAREAGSLGSLTVRNRSISVRPRPSPPDIPS